jgi:hypothetical protein
LHGEAGGNGELRFRNRHGLFMPDVPRSPPPGVVDDLIAENDRLGLAIGTATNRNG